MQCVNIGAATSYPPPPTPSRQIGKSCKKFPPAECAPKLRPAPSRPHSRWAPVGRSDIERNSNGVVGRRPLPPCRAAVGGTAGAHLAERHIIFLRISSLRNELVHMYICRFLYVQSVHASKSQCGFKVSMPQNVTTLKVKSAWRALPGARGRRSRVRTKIHQNPTLPRPPVPGHQTILWIWLSG